MQDQRSGDIYVDRGGSLVTIEDASLAMQECLVALKTMLGEETFDADWGLDLFSIIRNPFQVDPTLLVTSAVIACLDPAKILLISEAHVTRVQQSDDEDNPNDYYVDISVKTLNGNDIKLTTTMGE